MSIDAKDLSAMQPPVSPVVLGQLAALCWRMRKGRVDVLLVTSRETRRWVIPKGWPMLGLTPDQAAAQEAWEEAGVLGDVSSEALGTYVYDKIMRDRSARSCCVTVYPLRLRELKTRWPERKERRRKWFPAEEAAGLVQEIGLSELFLALAEDPSILVPGGRPRKGKERRAA
jgi:8-oxo-dGTP pyrophosphatase MutT (NUDIX family)